MRSREMMPFRFYRPDDKEKLVKIYSEQGLPVYMPIPYDEKTGQGDPAVAVAIVGEEKDGSISRALIARAGLEVSYVFNPSDPPLPRDLRRLSEAGEGAAMQLSATMLQWKFPAYTTVRARVPKGMTEMINFMQDKLGFVPETDQFVGLCKVIGR